MAVLGSKQNVVKDWVTTAFGILTLLVPILVAVGVFGPEKQAEIVALLGDSQGWIIAGADLIAAWALIFKAKDG